MKNSEIRKEARTKLQGKWGTAVGISLAYFLITFIFSYLCQNYPIISILFTIINIPLGFGIFISFMKLINNENVEIFDFVKYSFHNFGKAWNLYFRQILKLLLPSILFIVVFVLIFVLSTMMIAFSVTSTDSTGLIFAILGLCLSLIPLSIWLCVKSLLYVLAYPIAYEKPELSAKDVVEESGRLMKNHRWKFVGLTLSFIGWEFLAVLTFGIGMLWLFPYVQISIICFYKYLANKNTSNDIKTEVVEEKE